MITAQTLCQWLDLIWIPIALLTMERGKRIFTCLFIGGCVLLLRLQVQLLQEIGFAKGFFGLMDTPLLMRGQITYSVFIMLFMVLAYFSKGTDSNVHIAASISIMLVAFAFPCWLWFCSPMKKIKTAKGRKISSIKWLERQLTDPYVTKAKKEGYRSRAAYKLLEIDEKAKILKRGQVVVDLGAAPGGWCQVAANKGCRVVAIDLLEMDEIPGVTFFQMDFMEDDAPEVLTDALGGGGADVVLSDMAHNTIGHRNTDHTKIMLLVEAGYDFAVEILKPNGAFVAKVFQGGTETALLTRMKKDFKSVKHIKPPASRKESPETYVVATGFRKQ